MTIVNRPPRVALAALFVATVGLTSMSNAVAVDTGPPPSVQPASDPLDGARDLIRQSRWREAITELQKVKLTKSADWHNLMGYSHRKAKTPDLEAAQKHYDEALRLEPKHVGALEYSGELFLMKGDVKQARSRLATLASVCGRACSEYLELQAAIKAYEAGVDDKKPS